MIIIQRCQHSQFDQDDVYIYISNYSDEVKGDDSNMLGTIKGAINVKIKAIQMT